MFDEVYNLMESLNDDVVADFEDESVILNYEYELIVCSQVRDMLAEEHKDISKKLKEITQKKEMFGKQFASLGATHQKACRLLISIKDQVTDILARIDAKQDVTKHVQKYKNNSNIFPYLEKLVQVRKKLNSGKSVGAKINAEFDSIAAQEAEVKEKLEDAKKKLHQATVEYTRAKKKLKEGDKETNKRMKENALQLKYIQRLQKNATSARLKSTSAEIWAGVRNVSAKGFELKARINGEINPFLEFVDPDADELFDTKYGK